LKVSSNVITGVQCFEISRGGEMPQTLPWLRACCEFYWEKRVYIGLTSYG